MPTSAESEYLFRHAIVRDAAYALQLPSERAELHRIALDSLEATYGKETEAVALELLDHAAGAQDLERELHYLQPAVTLARSRFRHAAAMSLLKRLAAHPLSDTEQRAQAFVQCAEISYQIGEATTAREMANAVISLSASGSSRSSALIILGYLELLAGRIEQAADHMRQACEACGNDRTTKEYRSAQGNLARVLKAMGQTDEALELLHEVLESARHAGDASFEATALSNISTCGKDANAQIELLKQALTIARTQSLRMQQGIILNDIGDALTTLGQRAQAITTLQEAIAIHREVGYRRGEGVSSSNLAVLLEGQPALELLARALELAHEMGDHRAFGLALNNSADVLLQEGQQASALVAVRRAREHLTRARHMEAVATTWKTEAEVLQAMGQDADSAFARYTEVCRELGITHATKPLETEKQ